MRVVISVLPRRPRVQAVVADFELAFWQAIRKVLPGVSQRGCVFHFTQAVWRNIQEVGLQVAYTKDEAVNRICRKTIALPFLPAACIPTAFQELEAGTGSNSEDRYSEDRYSEDHYSEARYSEDRYSERGYRYPFEPCLPWLLQIRGTEWQADKCLIIYCKINRNGHVSDMC